MGKKIVAILLILIISISSLPMAIVEELEGALVSSAITTRNWSYEYKGYEETWVAPYTGYYNISCHGSGGHPGAGWGAEGSYVASQDGTLRASQAKIKKGTVLTIHVGGQRTT